MPDVKGVFVFLGSLLDRLAKGQEVRDTLIEDVNRLSAAMASCAAYSINRLNRATQAPDRKTKIAAIDQLDKMEIGNYGRMLGLCGPVAAAANSLGNHLLTPASVNLNIGSQRDALHLLETLRDGERGLGQVFEELLQKPSSLDTLSSEQLDAWALNTKRSLQGLWKEANILSTRLAEII